MAVRRLRLVVLVLALACGCAGSNRSDGPGTDAASDDVDRAEASGTLWPVDPADVALIANDNELAASDGATTVELLDITGFGVSPITGFAVHGSGDLVALKVGDEVAVVDLATGEVTRRSCPECTGVAVVGDQVVSADASFNMLVFDRSLRLTRTIPVDHVREARLPDTEEFEQTPTVVGTLDGRVAMTYLATNALVRGGPEILSVYDVDGTLVRSWTVDGLVYRTQSDAEGSRLLLGVGGSGGACNTLSSPVVLDADADEPVALLSEEDGLRDFRDLLTTDMWWNGAEPVAFGYYSGMAGSIDCAIEPVLWRFPSRGEPIPEAIDSVEQFRFLGDGCDKALLVSSEDVRRLDLIDDGRRETIDGYHTIVWSAPRSEPCPTLPGIERR